MCVHSIMFQMLHIATESGRQRSSALLFCKMSNIVPELCGRTVNIKSHPKMLECNKMNTDFDNHLKIIDVCKGTITLEQRQNLKYLLPTYTEDYQRMNYV